MRILASVLVFAITATPVAAQDADNGEEVYKKCRACHQVGATAKNAVGSNLNALFGRKAGAVEGFKYSDANQKSGIVWDEKNFAAYIKNPMGVMPGNRMAFADIKDDGDIADLIAFL